LSNKAVDTKKRLGILDQMFTQGFKTLTTNKELEIYRDLTAEKVHVELPMDYLQQARVIGLVDPITQKLHGGFTMAYQGKLRCIDQLPEKVVQTNPFIKKHKDRFFEINGLWLDHKSAPEGSRFSLYCQTMREAIRLTMKGKDKYVYAYCANNEKLRKFYKNFNSTELYEGPVRQLPGMDEPGFERIEMGCMKRLPLTIARNPLFLVSRAVQFKTPKLQWLANKESA
jgi:hypothetical protein